MESTETTWDRFRATNKSSDRLVSKLAVSLTMSEMLILLAYCYDLIDHWFWNQRNIEFESCLGHLLIGKKKIPIFPPINDW